MFKVISDTACDLSKSFTETQNIELVPLYVTFDGDKYYKDQLLTPKIKFLKIILTQR